ncbi:MAG: glycoside hydrolase family 43 protein [Bacillota bacterium]|jgi:beta-xylosidase|nr:glycoside hydrolase family 43 protein [Bacillota bacterium]
MSKHAKQNEPLVTHIYTADPSAHVFEDKIYIYPSHDLEHDGVSDDEGTQYTMEDYHVFSMDDIDAPVVDHGQVLHMKDVPWVSQQMWAPDAAFKNDTYYFYFPAKDKEGIFRIGVATSDNPAGPFKPEPNYIPGSYSIDPAVFIDDDGKAYMYAGGLWGGQLEKWQTGKFDPDAGEQNPDEIALGPWVAPMSDDMLTFAEPPVEFKILDENGKPLLAGDEDRRFFEAPWVHKYNGTYYLSYSTGSSHYIVYATSDNPMGPFTYRGRILEPVVGWTTHQSIVEFKGKWYLFYHDASLSGGIDHRRSIKFTEIKYNEDGTIQTIHPYK